MNHIYKVIWSRVKNSYVVVSEIAGTARKSGRVRVSKNTLAAVLAAFLLTGISVSPLSAALDGVNTFVEPGNQNIKIGNDIDLRNNSTKNGAIAIGDHAQIDDYVMQEGSIAIGKNAFVENMWGTQDKIFRFGMHSTDPSRTDHLLPAGIAIGQNTYARSGSLMIGDHKYVGALGDTTVNSNTDDEKRKLSVLVGATTVGLNSYSAGAFATTTGAYSIMTNAYDGNTNQGSAAQNFGAVINGSFNSIESKTAGSNVSGIANAVVGTANRTHNANGTLVFGAGNEVTNSVDNIADPMSLLTNSPKELAEKLREGIRRNDSGGAVLAVGGGNKADYAYRSQLIGVGNTLTGTAAEKAAYNLLNGYKNTGTKAEHVSVIGSQNTVENSKSQTVIGDSNKITDRNAGTVSGHQEERTKNVSDLVIGKGNDISGNGTYMTGHESLTVIGNNNKADNPTSSIVIGDNQKLSAIEESVVIGSMTPEEKADPDIQQKHASVVVGYHAQSGTGAGGGMNVALGHGAKAYGWQETVTGIKSIVEAGDSGYDGYLASVYGGLNTVASNKADQNDGMANTVVGTLNKTEGANGALVFGAGNSVTHSFGTAPTDENGKSMDEYWSDAILVGQKYAMGEGPLGHDELRKAMGLAMSTGGGSVVTMGNGNTSDYAVHSQIIGSGNILTGTANTPSINNTINGYANTGRNVERMSMMGTGNNMSGSTADVVIGDYHHKDGGKNNVILGSMATEKKTVEKTYTMKDASGNVILEKKYKVTENVPIKSHTANISNAVMLGYNTDVEKDGGVAIGADSVASVDKGAAGYDPSTDTASADTSATWKATAAAVSIGKAATPTSAAVTRQITNVAAGTQDTDAVNVAQLEKVNTKYDTKLSRGFIIKKGGEAVGETISLNGDTAPEITFDVAEANKGLTVDRDGKTIKYGIDGSKIDLNGNDTIPGWTLEVGIKPGIPTNTGSAEGNKKVIKPNDTVTLRADNGIRLKQENGVVDIGLKYMAVDTKWTNINDAAATNGGMAIGANSNADGETSVALGWGSNISASNYAAALSPFSSAVNSEYGLAMGTKAAVKTSPYGMAMGALSSVDDSEYGAAIGANSTIVNSNYGVVIGTSATVKDADNAVAIGVSSSAAVKNGVAIGAFSKADTAAGVSGYDPSTKAASTDTSAAWRSTVSAASVGDKTKGYTRQITGVAAGAADTDAVNVAQLKKAVAGAADGNDTLVGGSNGLSLSGKTLSMSVKDTAGNEVKGSVDLSSVADGNDKLVSDNNALSLNGNKLSMSVKDTAGNEVKGSVDLSAIAGQIDTNTTYTMSGTQNADNTTTITLKGSDGKENKVTVATKDTRNTVKAGENVTLDTAANTFGGTEYTVNVKADGKVENGNTKIVSGNTVYHETHVKNDGNYVKKENSAGDNLTILDKQVGKNTTNITNLGNTINNLNGKLGNLDNRISKVGAGAAALAALHPLDFDPHDKWDIAAGFGNYRNASAAAVGLFYRPNERTMMSLGWTMGDDRNMLNAGISVKLGRGDVYTRYSKVEMANQIKDLKEKNDKMQAENKEMRSELDELKAQVAALAAKK
ncbi:ESPR-type extended signal peptide-containing protein [Dialister invisus]|uniref:ESPR-type extended signal peptide-containing protein n=1 Tax=Dialister invisus TaxID=218538 RepID=UPI002E7759F2|nr:ESPR-type extended signal peptide-containing protein [Dialister invisus]MEE1473608.1 ESPR-type extended signal peptide-containing protein [Dialister invisus]